MQAESRIFYVSLYVKKSFRSLTNILDSMSIKKDWNIIKKRLPLEKARIDGNIVCAEKLVDFLIQAEDHRYKYHCGFDIIAIVRALYKNLFKGTKEGASTIEQQLVRVLTADYAKTANRKIKEIVLATRLKAIANKHEIALVYLNIAYYGSDYQNLDSILRKYDLSKNDYIPDKICAEIVARLKYPEPHSYSKIRNAKIEARTIYILNKYVKSKQKNYGRKRFLQIISRKHQRQ